VLGGGRVLEFDTPEVLLSNGRSHFSSLVEQSGVGEAEHLRMLVRNMETRRRTEGVILNEMTKEDSNETDPLM
jgi:hypothetical protein